MKDYLDHLLAFEDAIREIREIIITNIILVGQIPAPTFGEKRRAEFILERLSEMNVDECTSDSLGNPIGIIRGSVRTKPPIFIVAHIDTPFDQDIVHDFFINENSIIGPGVSDNSVGVGVLISLPEILKRLNLTFQSDVVFAGTIQSLGKGNINGIRHLLNSWSVPIRGGICLEGVNLGRLNYFSDGMIRGEIHCHVETDDETEFTFKPNAIIVLNELINEILSLRVPQKPRTRIIIGKISGGVKHGKIASDATIGFEIRSDSDKMVKDIYNDISDITEELNSAYQVDMKLNIIGHQYANRLKYNHPLVKSTRSIIKQLGLKVFSEPSESELSVFLSKNIPSVTIGVTKGDNFRQSNSKIEIEPIYKGIAQVIGVLMAIDQGVCDE